MEDTSFDLDRLQHKFGAEPGSTTTAEETHLEEVILAQDLPEVDARLCRPDAGLNGPVSSQVMQSIREVMQLHMQQIEVDCSSWKLSNLAKS